MFVQEQLLLPRPPVERVFALLRRWCLSGEMLCTILLASQFIT
jgi:hypothetical protein